MACQTGEKRLAGKGIGPEYCASGGPFVGIAASRKSFGLAGVQKMEYGQPSAPSRLQYVGLEFLSGSVQTGDEQGRTGSASRAVEP